MSLLAIDWPAVGLQVGQLLLALSILVVLHEFGHYITAKWFGCRVEKFYLFFNPWFSLFKKKVGETEYGIGWLPLGGYVKIAGMIDESMDKEQMKRPAEPWEFRSKPAWQRLIIMLGGIIMNVLTAFVIYAFVLMTWGDRKIPAASMKYGLHIVDSTLYKAGLRNGDKILSVDGQPITDFQKMRLRTLIGKEMTIERNGQKVQLQLPEDLIGQLIENRNKKVPGLLEPRIPSKVYAVSDTAASYKAGLRSGDLITSVDSTRVQFYDELRQQLLQKKGDSISLTVLRGTAQVQFDAKVDSNGVLGFYPYLSYQQMDSAGWLDVTVTNYTFFPALGAGVSKTFETLNEYINQFKVILNPKTGGFKGVGGFKSMGSIFPKYGWDWESFWGITAFLSIVLAFMNLLPIPALDGGHVMFTLYEMVSGKKPGDKFLEYAQMVGMVLLLGLMLYANLNDWFGWGK